MSDLQKEGILARLNTHTFGHPLTVVAETVSTNTDLRRMAAAGAPEGATLVAAAQTGGRGRRGRSFFSPTGGVYLSTLLRPAAHNRPELVTSCAAVAVARAIERLCPVEVGIKWVNDLYIRRRKVCGILAEADFTPEGQIDHIVLGVGINVAPGELPPELKAIATSLGNEGDVPSREALIAALLEEGEMAYATMDSGAFLAESRRRSVVLGQEVTVLQGVESFPATALAITEDGHLLVRTATEERLLKAGEVSLRVKSTDGVGFTDDRQGA
ncbi:MAG: biotin--[Clostridia bacterium]|nr:biotin--[acetyl-CoA-carboxylase] ligase [Clostridia bacterium]